MIDVIWNRSLVAGIRFLRISEKRLNWTLTWMLRRTESKRRRMHGYVTIAGRGKYSLKRGIKEKKKWAKENNNKLKSANGSPHPLFDFGIGRSSSKDDPYRKRVTLKRAQNATNTSLLWEIFCYTDAYALWLFDLLQCVWSIYLNETNWMTI